MEVILKQDVEAVGVRGDMAVVADGYARNFLIPRGFALKPTQANIRQIEIEKEEEARKRDAELDDLRQLAEKFSTVSCTVPVKVGEEGQMYGSVSAQDISEALKHEDFDVDPKSIVLDDPIKELGVYSFTIHLASEIEAKCKVWVVED